ncbi:MAG: RidA family protein [Armatimonadetes bacterium]|nr:RidA family protein [Armatimonadota bacterium]
MLHFSAATKLSGTMLHRFCIVVMENSTPIAVSSAQTHRRINPDGWTLNVGYSQAVEVRGDQKVLYCAGTTALDKNGQLPTALDIRSQMTATLDNLEHVLDAAGYGLTDLVKVTIYSTAAEQVLQNMDILVTRFQEHDALPTATLIGATLLAYPELLIEIEATAVR